MKVIEGIEVLTTLDELGRSQANGSYVYRHAE